MLLKHYHLGCVAHVSYLIGDQASGRAAVIDPQRDVERYVRDAAHHGMQITDVVLTHFHSDFVAGHLALRERVGARIHLGAAARAEYPFTPLADGDTLELGPRIRMVALETPGHAVEAIMLLVYDAHRDRQHPGAALTGDTLFIGDVGRPDLFAAASAAPGELAGVLFDSLHGKLLALPDETLIYPAHGAGAVCGRSLSTDVVSTIGVQRRYNYALQPMSREAFIRLLGAEQPDTSPHPAHDLMLNRQQRPALDRTLMQLSQPLGLAEVLRLRNAGARVVDVREPADFAGAHLEGSVNLALGGRLAGPVATAARVVQAPVVLIADPGRENEAVTRLARVGCDRIAGHLEGGMQALESRADLVRRTVRMTAVSLAEQLESANPPLLLDVRAPQEWDAWRIEGSLNVPLTELRRELAALGGRERIVVCCGTGYRSSVAASVLREHGIEEVSDLVGGIGAWEVSRLPLGPRPRGTGEPSATRTRRPPGRVAHRVTPPPFPYTVTGGSRRQLRD